MYTTLYLSNHPSSVRHHTTMPKLFSSNPLALSVPDAVFESWLRDTGYLEILDERTTAAAAAVAPPPPSAAASLLPTPTAPTPALNTLTLAFSSLRTLSAVITLNPFAKLTPDDFSTPTPSWTLAFIGAAGSYSWPAGASQARMRVQENVRRYARNYAFLGVIFFACCLYQMPVSLLGAIAALVVWEGVRFCGGRWEVEERHPVVWQVVARVAQIAIAVILYLCNLQKALICAISISYAVMLLHASLRKLTPSKQNQDRKSLQKKVHFSVK